MWLSMHVAITSSVHHYNCVYQERGLCQLLSGDAVVHGKAINCVPRGNNSNRLASDRGREETNHPRKDCAPRGEVASDTTCNVMQICNMNSAHGVSESDIFKCQGHMTVLKCQRHGTLLPGAQTLMIIKPQPRWLDPIRSDWLFLTIVTAAIPTPYQSWGTALRFSILNWLV